MWALVLGRGGFEPPKALGQLIYSQSRLTASVSARPRDFTDNRAMGTPRWILWQGLITHSMERFVVGASSGGFAFSADLAGPRRYSVRRPLSSRGRCWLAHPHRGDRARKWGRAAPQSDGGRRWRLIARRPDP